MKNYLVRNDRRNNGLDVFDDVFDSFFKPMFYEEKFNTMKTDIKENENSYLMDIEIPGFDKKDINVSLENGYLTISAQKKECDEGKKENYLRRERSCSVSRSYYVGDVKEESVKAKYESGVLTVEIPKEQPKTPTAKLINID